MQDTIFPTMPNMSNILTKITHHLHWFCSTEERTNSTETVKQSAAAQSADEYRSKDNYKQVRELADSSEGEIGVVRSHRTGKLLIAKHTKARQTVRFGNGPLYLFPDEAKILLQTLKGAQHPNVIQMFGVEKSWEPGRHLLLLEYCSGGDLLDQLRHFGALSKHAYGSSQHKLVRKSLPTDTLAHPLLATGSCHVPAMFLLHLFVGLAQALAFIHDTTEHEAVIHGDIKPDNVLLRWSPPNKCGLPDVVLADFGASQLESKSYGVTGTPGYDSPEVFEVTKLRHTEPRVFQQKKTQRIMTTKSDIYQLGHVMYLFAAMRRWKTGADPETLALPAEYTTTHCRNLAVTIAWCLAVTPSKRPSAGTRLLPLVQTFREQRDLLFSERGALPRACWKQPQV